MSKPSAELRFWIPVSLLLAIVAAVQVLSIRQESMTYDEGVELTCGYVYLKTGLYRMVVDHPPLAKLISALPLAALNPRIPFEDPAWALPDGVALSKTFLYHNRVPADRLIFWGRAPTIVATGVLALAIAIFARRRFGPVVGMVSVGLFAFDPNVIAVGRYVKDDVLVTLFCFLACAAWDTWLRGGRGRSLALAAIVSGLAFCTKFSAVFLLPVFAVQYWLVQRKRPIRKAVVPALVICAAWFAIAMLVYAPYLGKALPMTPARRAANPDVVMLRDTITADTERGRVLRFVSTKLGLAWPSHPLYAGLRDLSQHNERGHRSYLLGMYSTSGWWYYFPVAFLVKTPVATLAAIGLALLIAVRKIRKISVRAWAFFAVPICVYGLIAMNFHINTGERHLMPIYPFLFIATGAALAGWQWRFGRVVTIALAVGLVLESLSVYPHFLAFFNFASGGPANGAKYLLDSNLDWGQDLPHLKQYMTDHQAPEVCLAYFGTAEVEAYGIQHRDFPAADDAESRRTLDCVGAISATILYGVYDSPSRYAWLREQKPVAKVGYSIYVYDLRGLK